MRTWQGYCKDVLEYTVPYIRRGEAMAKKAKKRMEKGQCKVKRRIRFLKIKQAVELTGNLVLLIAAAMSLFSVIRSQFFQSKD